MVRGLRLACWGFGLAIILLSSLLRSAYVKYGMGCVIQFGHMEDALERLDVLEVCMEAF